LRRSRRFISSRFYRTGTSRSVASPPLPDRATLFADSLPFLPAVAVTPGASGVTIGADPFPFSAPVRVTFRPREPVLHPALARYIPLHPPVF
jgi:hypothetical protein